MLLVLDVSAYQARIDWPRVVSAGVAAVWIKATEGATLPDKLFAEHAAGANDAGLPWGAYHFLTETPADAQAAHFLDVSGSVAPVLPPMLDLERSSPGEAVATLALDWLHAVADTTQTQPIVYTGPAFAAVHLAAWPAFAAYTNRPALSPCPPWPADGWTIWQFTGTGTIAGVEGKVDVSRARSIPGLAG